MPRDDDDDSEELEQLRDEVWSRARRRGPLDQLIAWLLFLFLMSYMSFQLWQDRQAGGSMIHRQRITHGTVSRHRRR